MFEGGNESVKKHKVLVLDVNDAARTCLGHFLSSRGYEVDCLGSGQDVISRLVSVTCLSVILLDLPVTKLSSGPATAKLEELYGNSTLSGNLLLMEYSF